MNVIVQLDPHKQFTEVGIDRLYAACGLLPVFFTEAVMSRSEGVEGVTASLTDSYGFGRLMDMGPYASVKDGVWESEDDDPDLYPLASLQLSGTGCTGYIYQYGFVAVVSDEDPTDYFITRMD